ncbi:hypothetical protein GUJ93_ZPchr0012g19194 [Zizania palustris]|uniref:F-box domain-containing protein n=1 Tax=Zizania palustris TaxID=103762 RepID=A0A8J5WNN9_ZIZPA|nr:hypothetical protein GUJ93_ZPchr0012g19194 [Zizania palustris]
MFPRGRSATVAATLVRRARRPEPPPPPDRRGGLIRPSALRRASINGPPPQRPSQKGKRFAPRQRPHRAEWIDRSRSSRSMAERKRRKQASGEAEVHEWERRKRGRRRERRKGGGGDPVEVLGEEVMGRVMEFLDGRSVARCTAVSRAWRRVAAADCLWAPKVRFLLHPPPPLQNPPLFFAIHCSLHGLWLLRDPHPVQFLFDELPARASDSLTSG